MLFFMSEQSDPAAERGADPREGGSRCWTSSSSDYVQTATRTTCSTRSDASRDYDPGPGLEKIRAPLLAINFADDLINPPELGILESEIKRVPNGRAVVLPLSEKTRGHGSHTMAALWKDELVDLLKRSEH